ncbi:alpha-amylase family glycosyl hydrolase [Endozoicomonas montiporae]|uniref:Sucrose phosphorylase-like n=1 Tax=Endozoicomonas montiporae CL-33 TaxID=570277 RepID=A0A142B6X7_9GAMM|nr:alpha-amylase family glycosyl hydrolase [Endozoicomonas montiporae]AMO54503.1 sucrose phosphorylase-like [Endozoicomonas montiporae CL-33]
MQSYPDAFKDFHAAIVNCLQLPYGEQAEDLASMVVRRVEHFLYQHKTTEQYDWSEQDIFLISYGNSLIDRQRTPPLQLLKQFLQDHTEGVFNTLHILPYFPFSSDDGFSVIDFMEVNPELGTWEDIQSLSNDFRLMTDLVINHVSRESLWFADYLSGIQPGRDYFIEVDPTTDLSDVTRPRNSPLLVSVTTRRGIRHIWGTFSEDQLDLNFRNPEVLIKMVDIFLFYLSKGTSVIRLDAIAYLWKTIGTSCIHRPETHAIVKLLRLIMNKVRPGGLLLTETNVPNEENLSYFGTGDEAHIVYQFALPPLLLHALNRGTEKYLVHWAKSLPDYKAGCTVLNFTASHDGIGLRALEGIVPDNETQELVDSMHRFGGFISVRTLDDQTEKPYEINISLFDALKGTRRGEDQWQIQRFLCSQIIMLGMRGIPAVYIHSLLATPNDLAGVERTGRTRSINRRKWFIEELLPELDHDPMSVQSNVFHALIGILNRRKQEPCFHPDNTQTVVEMGTGLFAFRRTDQHSFRSVLAIHNLTAVFQKIELPAEDQKSVDLLTGSTFEDLTLKPYQCVWLVNASSY